jgi:hypothetical protein
MGRVAARKAREARERWASELAGVPYHRPGPAPKEEPGRGIDYDEADTRWVCNRKKAYGSRWMAEKVAARINQTNETADARPGFRGVHVTAYLCRRCGEYHIGR